MKAATIKSALKAHSDRISIHAAREGGDAVDWNTIKGVVISIHAAREGGDDKSRCTNGCLWGISIHAAREGGDLAGAL